MKKLMFYILHLAQGNIWKIIDIWNPVYRICDDYKYDRYKKCSNSIYVISLINFSATQNSWMNRIDYIDTYVAHANIKNTN